MRTDALAQSAILEIGPFPFFPNSPISGSIQDMVSYSYFFILFLFYKYSL